MAKRGAPGHLDSVRQPSAGQQPRTWKLEDAKARFSEVVRRARSEGPQRVTVRGRDAVVVIAEEVLAKLQSAKPPRRNLVEFLQGLGIGDMDIARDRDTGRDINL